MEVGHGKIRSLLLLMLSLEKVLQQMQDTQMPACAGLKSALAAALRGWWSVSVCLIGKTNGHRKWCREAEPGVQGAWVVAGEPQRSRPAEAAGASLLWPGPGEGFRRVTVTVTVASTDPGGPRHHPGTGALAGGRLGEPGVWEEALRE